MGKKSKKVEKNSQRNFIKQGGGGSKAVYKLYKKTGKMVRDGFPLTASICENFGPFLSYIERQNNPKYGNLWRNFHIYLTETIPDICHHRYHQRWCTFFKPAYFFPQRTRMGLLLAKFIQRI